MLLEYATTHTAWKGQKHKNLSLPLGVSAWIQTQYLCNADPVEVLARA